MTTEQLLNLMPIIFALAMTTTLMAYVWFYRRVEKTRYFFWYILAQCGWLFFFILEIASDTLETKQFWDSVQWGFTFVYVITALLFVLDVADHPLLQRRLLSLALPGFPLVFMVLVFTDPLHGLAYHGRMLVPGQPFSAFIYDFTPFFWSGVIFAYILALSGVFVLLDRALKARGLARLQVVTVILGFVIPLTITNLALLFDMRWLGQRDVAPLTLAVSNFVVAWGIFRYRLFDIVPIARNLMLENIGDSVVVLDNENRVLDLNADARAAADPTLTDVVGLPCERVFPDWREIFADFKFTEQANAEFPVTQGEQKLYINLKIVPIRDRKGKRIGRLFRVQDVTEQAQIREALKQKVVEVEAIQRRYDALFKNIPGMAYIFGQRPDDSYFFDYVSERAHDITGFTPAQIYADPNILFTQFDPDYVERHRQLIAESARNLTPFFSEIPVMVKGQWRWHQFNSSPTCLEDGTVLWHGITLDVTDRKQAEERYKLFTDLTFEAIIINREGVALDMNATALKMFGYTRDEMLGKRLIDLLPTEAYRDYVHGMIKEQDTDPYEIVCRRKDGSTFPAEVEARQVMPDTHVTAIRDITERRQAMRGQLQLELEKERTQLLTSFIQAASHEFRTPLASIGVNIYLMSHMDNAERRSEKAVEVQDNIDKITDLLDDMILMMKLDQQPQLQLNPVNINESVQAALGKYLDEIKDKQQQLDLHLADNLPLFHGDAEYLNHAVSQLINNAINFTPETGTITILTEKEGLSLKLTITDSGVGMGVETQEMIFQHFYRRDEARSTAGFGLGLPIAQRIVELHHGTIRVLSELNAGSTFIIKLPLDPTDKANTVQNSALTDSAG